MSNPNFDYQGAKKAGYSDEEIQEYLSSEPSYKNTNTQSAWQNIKNNASNFFGNFGNPVKKEESPLDSIDRRLLKKVPNFDVEGAISAGYSPEEINEFLEENQPKRSKVEKAGRIGAQLGLGLAENALLPYELGVVPLSSKEAQNIPYREDLGSELEDLMIQKQSGNWTPEDELFLKHIQEQIEDPRKSMQFAQTADLGVRGLAEQATGLDLLPEGALEKGANWIGYIKNPSQIFKSGINPKEIIKGIAPTGKEALRGLGAGVALQAAEDGEFGPIGTMAAAVIGDTIGHGLASGAKGLKNLVTNPKKTLADVAKSFSSKEKRQLQQDIIKDFRDSGLQADLGTITDSNLIKWTQSRLSQSGLTGKALDDFRHELTDQIKRQYSELAQELGNAKFATEYEAGETLKNTVKNIREADLQEIRELYKNASSSLKPNSYGDTRKLARTIERIKSELQPGSLKSSEQQSVLNALDTLERDILDSTGKPIFANVKDLMNNKIALNDIINYEVQGGQKQLLKEIVSELDRAIISHGKENPTFAKNYILSNKKFATHAKTFRNKDISNLLRTENPSQILNRMNSIHGIRNLEKVLSKSSEGKKLFEDLKRMKLDEVIGNKMVDNVSQQVKLGTFSKILEKGKNRDIIREILPKNAFVRLEKLQKNAGRLADAADKFYNSSKSGTIAADAAVIAKGMSDIAHVLSGNPWPIMKLLGGIVGARKLSELLSDPQFLKLVEEAMLASEKGSEIEMKLAFSKLRPYLMQAQQQDQEQESF
jgi:hypothetical protein